MAKLLAAQGKLAEAADCERRGLDASRRLAESQNRRALEFMAQGRVSYAIMELQYAITTLPDFAPTYLNLGDAAGCVGSKGRGSRELPPGTDHRPAQSPGPGKARSAWPLN